MLLKKVKLSLESFSDDDEVVSRVLWVGWVWVFVKYFDNDSESDDKENENIWDWLGFDDDFDDGE